MALFPCPECHTRISRSAELCPKCGVKITALSVSQHDKNSAAAGIVVLVLGVLFGIYWLGNKAYVYFVGNSVQAVVVEAPKRGCYEDLYSLESRINNVIKVGKTVAGTRLDGGKIYSLMLSASSPLAAMRGPEFPEEVSPVGSCGVNAELAFSQFVSAFSYALGVEHADDYAAQTEEMKKLRMEYFMGEMKKARNRLDQELAALRILASSSAGFKRR